MKRAYELALVVRMDPNQAVIDESIEQIRNWIQAEDYGVVTGINRWGQRRLAYEIDSQRDGYYVFIDMNIDPLGLPELESNMKLTNTILRYLIVRQDDIVEETPEEDAQEAIEEDAQEATEDTPEEA